MASVLIARLSPPEPPFGADIGCISIKTLAA